MKFDVFFSICQIEIDGYLPSERVMFENFFDQVMLADSLGFETAWVAESHLSSETQKQNPNPVVPYFKGEVGLNTDINLLAQRVFSKTKRIEVGSAIRNILCNGGPLAHAESIRMFLSLHGLNTEEKRRLNIGFAAGRFDYSNRPYGVYARNRAEVLAWNLIKPKVFLDAVEIFCRALRGDTFSSQEISAKYLSKSEFRDPETWEKFCEASHEAKSFEIEKDQVALPPHWVFETLKIIPQEAPLDLLSLTIGSHDPKAQILANSILPCKVFNLSITPVKTLEDTHERMKTHFHPKGGPWQRDYLPRTILVFLEAGSQWSPKEQSARARERAQKTLGAYWQAMEGTLNLDRVKEAVENALCGCPEEIADQLCQRFHPDDRLMLWFDFNCHDNERVKQDMRAFAEKVIPLTQRRQNEHTLESAG